MPGKTNKVNFGLSNVYIAKETETDKYDTPKPVPGAVERTRTPKGDSSDFYADNQVWYHSENNQGYDETITFATVPDWFWTDIMGYELEEESKCLVERRDAKPSRFAMGYQVEGDEQNRRAWEYGITASRPEQTNSTMKTTGDETPEETYNTWFEKVQLPKDLMTE